MQKTRCTGYVIKKEKVCKIDIVQELQIILKTFLYRLFTIELYIFKENHRTIQKKIENLRGNSF